MNHSTAKSKRVFLSLAIILLVASILPLYQMGMPWIQFHQNNFVVYDCRLHSDCVPVGSKYPGRIDELFVQIGQRVVAGDIIARMDSRELRARIDKANATIELAKANVAAEKIAIEKALATMIAQQECLVAKSQVTSSRVKAIQEETKWIEKQLVRAKKLAKRGSISQTDLEKILREFENFENKAQIAGEEDLIANLDLTAVKLKIEEIQSRSSKLMVLRQEINIARSELKSIDEQKQASIVKANNSGIVTSIFRGAGSSVKIGDPIIQIQDDNLWCQAWIDEKKFPDIDQNANVNVTLKAYPNRTLKGKVSSFLPTPESVQRNPQDTDNPILQRNSKVCVKIHLHPTWSMPLIPGLTGTAVISKHKNVRPILAARR